MQNWLTIIKENLLSKTADYTGQEKQNLEIEYLKNLLIKIEINLVNINDEELKSKVDYVVNEMPLKTLGKKLNYQTKHLNEISNLQTYVEEKYNFIKKNQLRNRYFVMGMPLGMIFGVPIASAIDKIALGPVIGFPIGMIVGAFIGNRLDKKAEKENKVL